MNPEKRRRLAKAKAKAKRKQRERGKDRVAALFRGEYELTKKGLEAIKSWM